MPLKKTFWILFFLLGGISGVWAREKKPHFVMDPPEAVMDEIVRIRILNLPPGAIVEIVERTREREGRAIFVSDKKGTVDLSRDLPLSGSCYGGVNPMGLFQFSHPAKEETDGPEEPTSDSVVSEFRAELEGQAVANARLTRWWLKPQTKVKKIREPGFAADLYEPPAARKKSPAIIILSGSEGGMNDQDAALLSAHGYVALALAYFKEEGLPQNLVHIPVETVKRGLDFLRSLPDVDPDRIGLFGGSKGAELALLAASCYPEISAVVAYVPSHVVWAGMRGFMGVNESSWTHKGESVPFVPFAMTPEFFKMLKSNQPWKIGVLYVSSLKNGPAVEKALIPVERIKGAVMLISGKDDQVWPSSSMAEKIIDRLQERHFPFPAVHLAYADAGHGIAKAFIPMQDSVISGRIDAGGTVAANAAATRDSKPKVLKFLKENLRGRR